MKQLTSALRHCHVEKMTLNDVCVLGWACCLCCGWCGACVVWYLTGWVACVGVHVMEWEVTSKKRVVTGRAFVADEIL